MTTLGSRYPQHDLFEKLSAIEKIVYCSNGNRTQPAEVVLDKIEQVLPLVGITRVADISQLCETQMSVFQSSRPRIISHSFTGQNTGSQGKGLTPEQAKISCLMEAIESFCLEPRDEILIRGSYSDLKNHHIIAPPQMFALQQDKNVRSDEVLMWTKALSLENQKEVLIPAETTYFPFFPANYNTEPRFVTGTNGAGAGFTYLEAVIHGLLEVIERHYFALWEIGKIKPEAIFSCDLKKFKKVISNSEMEIELMALEIPNAKNVSMVTCFLVSEDGPWFYGNGCCLNVDVAISRALSEAYQSFATKISGGREDLNVPHQANGNNLKNFPFYQTLSLADYKKRVIHKNFSTLNHEFNEIVSWLHDQGFLNIFITNMTRVGIDVPVVKVIVPGLLPLQNHRHGLSVTSMDIDKWRYGEGIA